MEVKEINNDVIQIKAHPEIIFPQKHKINIFNLMYTKIIVSTLHEYIAK